MLLFKKVSDFQAWLKAQRTEGRSIGFVPTMGALHPGHLDLVHQANQAGDVAVVSIFVNPTQFNDLKDLEKYPRLPGQDLRALALAGCAAVWMPPVVEVYPPGQDLSVRLDFGALDKVMEGQFRPGHFTGMAMVVNRLLDVVQPHHLYMGQKDFQQMSIVRDMLRQQRSNVKLVACPTIRESDGLAMSSRNLRLTPDMRAAAPAIYQTLQAAKTRFAAAEPASAVSAWAMQQLTAAGLRPEYVNIVDARTLLPVEHISDAAHIVVCAAAWAGEIRLIDNLMLKGEA